MLIIIDGTYGVGKTATVFELKKAFLDDSFMVFEPDADALNNLSNEEETQFYIEILIGLDGTANSVFLTSTRKALLSVLSNSENVIMPMTLASENGKRIIVDYFTKLNLQIRHFILEASWKTIKNRVEKQTEYDKEVGSENVRDINLVLNSYSSNTAFLAKNYLDAIRINTEGKSTYQVAEEISNHLRTM